MHVTLRALDPVQQRSRRQVHVCMVHGVLVFEQQGDVGAQQIVVTASFGRSGGRAVATLLPAVIDAEFVRERTRQPASRARICQSVSSP